MSFKATLLQIDALGQARLSAKLGLEFLAFLKLISAHLAELGVAKCL